MYSPIDFLVKSSQFGITIEMKSKLQIELDEIFAPLLTRDQMNAKFDELLAEIRLMRIEVLKSNIEYLQRKIAKQSSR